MEASAKPAGYEHDLSDYKACLFDPSSGEPIGWGMEILHWLGEERFEALRHHGSPEYAGSKWFLIVKWLTRQEAIEKYGPITAEEFGPRGGFRSITFGDKKFIWPGFR